MNKRIQKATLPDYFHIFISDFKICLYHYAVVDSGWQWWTVVDSGGDRNRSMDGTLVHGPVFQDKMSKDLIISGYVTVGRRSLTKIRCD